jgi:hypothetical protein
MSTSDLLRPSTNANIHTQDHPYQMHAKLAVKSSQGTIRNRAKHNPELDINRKPLAISPLEPPPRCWQLLAEPS